MQPLEDIFTTTLTHAQTLGELDSQANPRNLARLLLCTTQGVALLGLVMDNNSKLAGAVESLLSLLEN
ncbi:hypothetical protein WJM97_08275 [Okeanomitos corallinicola TIOX110]|uniref:TetR family transcriptional regulator n=1 Tax=Okeanomitos corallinicola TIOX110 TaxID=3133117 RepID=A0ABZ2UW99_9CYAN